MLRKATGWANCFCNAIATVIKDVAKNALIHLHNHFRIASGKLVTGNLALPSFIKARVAVVKVFVVRTLRDLVNAAFLSVISA